MTKSDFHVHRTWQEAAGIALGAVAALSPFLTGQTTETTALWSTAVAGSAVLLLSAVGLLSLSRLTQYAKVLAGLWLTVAPFALGYEATAMALLHHLAGPAILMLSTLELWQDWHLTDAELERYGKAA